MALTKQQKQEQIAQLTELMKKSQSVAFASYTDISVADQTQIRNELREGGAELKVAKKTLLALAAKEAGFEGFSTDMLDGQIVAAFSYEEPTTGPQVLKKAGKTLKSIKLQAGLFEGKALAKAQVQELADLPPREVLLAKLMGSMMSPLSGFVGVGSNVISGFVRVLDGHRENLEKA
jgi:large subunit ribosomal protein L10